MRIDTATLTYLTEILSEHSDDLETFWDTLDGETDIMDMVGSAIQDLVTAEADEAKLDLMIQKYTQRRDAVRARQRSLKTALKSIMVATNQNKIPHTLGTVSLREGAQSVVIEDEREIPSQLCKTTIIPDKATIKKLLTQGETISGAVLVRGPQSVSIRMK